MKKAKITTIFGTRPEAIKMCPLILELQKHNLIDLRVCLTGQHGDMVKDILVGFGVSFDVDLAIMVPGQTLFDITEKSLRAIKKELSEHTPDLVLVHGDTSSAFAASLSSFYMQIPVGHVEAGLRTGNIHSPFPEEFNRCAIDKMSDLCFCPTEKNMQNLVSEGKEKGCCFVTGNTIVDALKYTTKGIKKIKKSKLRILMTVHRRENLGSPMQSIFKAVLRAALKYDGIEIFYPVHPNPQIRKQALGILGNSPQSIILTEPMNVFPFHRLLASCDIVLTDSGGIQEEACALGIPIILARDTTERTEAAECGNMIVAGTKEESVFSVLCNLIENEPLREKMSLCQNPFGSGDASARITEIILSYIKNSSP